MNKRLTAEWFRSLPINKRKAALEKLSESDRVKLFYNWRFFARDKQLPPEQWGKDGCYIWYLRCGRGNGKTRTAAETFRYKIEHEGYRYTSLCGATTEEVRDIMINGESGLMNCCPPWFRPEYRPSVKKIIWPNGSITSIFYGTEPEKSRGMQSDLVWMDEIHKWQYPEETFDNLILGLRLGKNPLAVVTSTPKPVRFCRELEQKKTADGKPAVAVTVGTTYENKANLSPVFFSAIISKYEGTRIGEQELNAQIMDDNPNALFKREILERDCVDKMPEPGRIRRIVVAVDPAASSKAESNHTGIIVCAEGNAPDSLISGKELQYRDKKHFYIYEDASLIGVLLMLNLPFFRQAYKVCQGLEA
ncbi:MAG: terminase family protein [Treponema sp.]|jgi:phage terminase large subunit-like protein|nr:terminase family protein [Treponema sp.]